MPALRKLIFIALWWLAVTVPSYAQALSPAKLLAEIDRDGPKATISRLTESSSQKDWEHVLDRIAGGKHDWLRVAARLKEGSDAGSSTALYISVAYALPKNPSDVLAMTGPQEQFQIEEVCGVRFIEAERAFLRTYMRQTKRALAKMKDDRLTEQRQACLQELGEAERAIFPPSPSK